MMRAKSSLNRVVHYQLYEVIMKEQLITFETAKLAKDKGFKISCEYAYYYRKEHFIEDVRNHGDDIKVEYIPPRLCKTKSINEEKFYGRSNHEIFVCEAPTQSLLQKWLREEHDIYINLQRMFECNVDPAKFEGFIIHIGCKTFEMEYSINKELKNLYFNTYEQALEEGLKEGLNLINI